MRIKLLLIMLGLSSFIYSQIDSGGLLGLPTGTNAEMLTITGVEIGALLFNTTDQKMYRYTTTGWVSATDSQNASEVDLLAPVDVNNISGDPGAVDETTVEEVVQAIVPITSKAGRVFYPPSIVIEAGVNGTFTKNLFNEYTAQFATPVVESAGAPSAIPVYNASDLYYYVTYADPSVFDVNTMSIDASGVLTYTIIGQPTDLNSLINVVFVVK